MYMQGENKEKEEISYKTGKAKTSWGGKRPNQTGRPKRMDEQAIIEKLTPMAETAFKVLNQKILDGDMNAIKLYMSYFLGMPTQKVESKIEGQLNQVSVEVVRPELVKEEVLVN
jgi:hypothetical protein